METAAGEHVIFEGHPSWRSILGLYLRGILLAALAGAVAALVTRISKDEVRWGVVAAVVAAAVALAVLAGLVKRISTRYAITNLRLHIRRGIISRRVQETRLDRVQNVNTSQSALQRILQVGTVDFDTAGSDDYDFSFVGVANPEDVVRAVDAAMREAAAQAPETSR